MKTKILSWALLTVLAVGAQSASAGTKPLLECKYQYTIYDDTNLKTIKEVNEMQSKLTVSALNPGGQSSQNYAAISVLIIDDIKFTSSVACKSDDVKSCDFISIDVVRSNDEIGNTHSALSKNQQVELRSIVPLVEDGTRYSVILMAECTVK